ncbi:MAG: TerB family tellurite resistance protein [Pseudomonadota bacterium]
MAITDFSNLLQVFGKGAPSDVELKDLFKEVSLVTLARATSADTNIHPIEVEAVQASLKRLTGEDIDAAQIRVAAKSELFERAPLGKYLTRASRQLDAEQRVRIVFALLDVIKSDVRVSPFETDFFDMVADALAVTPSQLVGLVQG